VKRLTILAALICLAQPVRAEAPTIGACQVAAIEALSAARGDRAGDRVPGNELIIRAATLPQAEWRAGMEVLNQLGEHGHSYSFTQAECLEISNAYYQGR
jgi:hypothetical protein